MRLLLILAGLLLASPASAACACQCVGGTMQAICSGTIDLAAMCKGMCGITSPSVTPIKPPTGTPVSVEQGRTRRKYPNHVSPLQDATRKRPALGPAQVRKESKS
jgi:hypothetical protein